MPLFGGLYIVHKIAFSMLVSSIQEITFYNHTFCHMFQINATLETALIAKGVLLSRIFPVYLNTHSLCFVNKMHTCMSVVLNYQTTFSF